MKQTQAKTFSIFYIVIFLLFLFPTGFWIDKCSAETVNIGYIVPSDRLAQPQAVTNLQNAMTLIQSWYREQMDRFGFGPKTFTLETQSGSLTPQVHTANTTYTAAYIRQDTWGKTIGAAIDGGLSPWARGQTWLLVPEIHVQQPDSSVVGSVAYGGSFGSGSDGGVAVIGADCLPLLTTSRLVDQTPYAGHVIPEVGPYPFVQNVTHPWYEGTTFSSITSSAFGAIAHELTHGFGLPHDLRNDDNFHGNLTGNGLRGFRGWFSPETFPQDDIQLTYGAALALNSSRYFNPDVTYTEDVKPTVTVMASGTVTPVKGKVEIPFHASDASGLACAWLLRNGNLEAEMPLTGQSVDISFQTPYYTPGTAEEYKILIYDTQGNRTEKIFSLTPRTGYDRAPQPFISIANSIIRTDMDVLLDARKSIDPDHTYGLKVEWDLNGDGVFDTAPSSDLTFTTHFDVMGSRLIYARLTDLEGNQSISEPLGLRIVPEPTTALGIIFGCLLTLRRKKV